MLVLLSLLLARGLRDELLILIVAPRECQTRRPLPAKSSVLQSRPRASQKATFIRLELFSTGVENTV